MANPKSPAGGRPRPLIALGYLACVAAFAIACAQFHLPGKGFTFLLTFGGGESARYLPELRHLPRYEAPDSAGYDAQYYSQIAMHPRLGDPEIRAAVDDLPYRARRILFCWTAYGLAGGNPARALQIYAVQNIVCWFVLGFVLLRWFPATTWGNFFRWAGVMASAGLCFSVRGSLVDGPSLLLIAIAIALEETGRRWWAAGVLGISGLARETNLLAGAALLSPAETKSGRRGVTVLRGLVAILPLALWMVCLRAWVGSSHAELGNFGWPFAAYFSQWRDVIAHFSKPDAGLVPLWRALILVALLAQWVFFAVRREPQQTWWRVGAAYALLMVFLGKPVWEGYPGAAARVLLPMLLAFNVLVPRRRAWLPLLLAGNLTLLFSFDAFEPPGGIDSQVKGPAAVIANANTGEAVSVRFDEHDWFSPERTRWSFWRWSRGSAGVVLHNPQPFPVTAEISFAVSSNSPRSLHVKLRDRTLWQGSLTREPAALKFPGIELPPGDTVCRFETDEPGAMPNQRDARALAIRVQNFTLRLTK